jgi:hypothetical protein
MAERGVLAETEMRSVLVVVLDKREEKRRRCRSFNTMVWSSSSQGREEHPPSTSTSRSMGEERLPWPLRNVNESRWYEVLANDSRGDCYDHAAVESWLAG